MSKALYFYPVYPSFVQSDGSILRSHYRVAAFYFKAHKKWLTPFYFLFQLCFLIVHIASAKVLVSHFSGYHTLLPAVFARTFRKAHIVLLNGTECHNFPEHRYGYLSKPLLFWFSWKSLQWSSLLIPASESLVDSTYTYAPAKYVKQGFKNFYANLHTPYQVIYNGVDPTIFPLEIKNRKSTSFISIASDMESPARRAIKGIDLVIALAKCTPDNTYTLIGASSLRNDLPANIILAGFVPYNQLHKIYNQHAFYLQLSASEGFGLALCEAMLCGCVPIVSNVGILPFIASGRGYVLQHKNVDDLVELVSSAVKEYDPDNITYYRDHILENFTLAKRAESLLAAISNTTKA